MNKIEYLANFHTILDFDDVVKAAEETFMPEVFAMNYENLTKLQAMCIQKNGYEGRKKAIKAAYAYGLIRGMIATKKGYIK